MQFIMLCPENYSLDHMNNTKLHDWEDSNWQKIKTP